MDQSQEISQEEKTMQTLVSLTNVFESIASMKIAAVKNQVLQSHDFFKELWHIYSQLRVSQEFNFGRYQGNEEMVSKDLIVIVTAEGGFSGDIDDKLINLMLREYSEQQHDIIVVGHHGAIRLAQKGVQFKRYYKLPSKDKDINVGPIVVEVQNYRSTTVYYQTYVSLMVQDVRRINLSSVVQEQGKAIEEGDEEISEDTYIFEPSTEDVITHLERSMLYIAMEQVILESKLAQYASRFRAMGTAHDKAKESLRDIRTHFFRVNRAVKDERIKETLNGLRKVRVA